MNHSISTRSYKETSDLIAQLFDGNAVSFAQTDIIVQELMKRNALAVVDYVDFHFKEHKSVNELTATELGLIADELRSTLRAVEAKRAALR